jgi:hypothetical protein
VPRGRNMTSAPRKATPPRHFADPAEGERFVPGRADDAVAFLAACDVARTAAGGSAASQTAMNHCVLRSFCARLWAMSARVTYMWHGDSHLFAAAGRGLRVIAVGAPQN